MHIESLYIHGLCKDVINEIWMFELGSCQVATLLGDWKVVGYV